MMGDKEVSNPIAASVSSTADDPTQLGATIKEGIFAISEGKRWLVEVELQRLRDQADLNTAPEAMHNLLLFRKYAEIAFQIKDENAALKSQEMFPSILPEAGNDESLLNGYNVLRSNFFWLRVLSAVFSLISCAVMTSVKDIEKGHYRPDTLGGDPYSNCGLIFYSGYFETRSYVLLIVVGALVAAHTLGIAVYYVLPVDAEGKKYIPGFRTLVEECLGNEQDAANLLDSGVPVYLYTLFRCVGVLVDHCLLVLSVVAFVLAAVRLDAAVKYDIQYTTESLNWDGSTTTSSVIASSYYTIPTFFKSFSCLGAEDPTSKMQASLAMLFFSTCLQALRLAVVWRRTRRDARRAVPADKQKTGAGESGEAFLAAPLATSETEDGEDEDVAITFSSENRESKVPVSQAMDAV